MNKKILIAIGILVIAVILLGGCVKKLKPTAVTITTTHVTTTTSPSTTTIPGIEVKVETICTDHIDNDGDGLMDNEDGDCWMREGPIYEVSIATIDTPSGRKYSTVTNLVPALKDLGIKTIYLLPIWVSPQTYTDKTSGYNIVNYSQLNPYYGTEKDLHDLVDTVHANNMRILFDLVVSYKPDSSVEYENHPEWFLHYPDGTIYKWRWGYSTDHTSPGFIDSIADAAEYYVKEYHIDGWRVDAPTVNIKGGDEPRILLGNGDNIPQDYGAEQLIKEVKRRIINLKSDAVLYPESPGPLCEKDPPGCDTSFDKYSEVSYNWYFSGWLDYPIKHIPTGTITYRNGFLDKIVTNKATSEDLVNYLANENIKYNRSRSHFSENHDTQRVQLAYPDQNKNLLVLISTITGIPMIFAGQEIGDTKKLSSTLTKYNTKSDLYQFHKKVFSIRSSHAALKYGDIQNVWKSGDNTFAYSRTYEDETVVVVINFKGKQATSVLNVPFNKGDILKDELSGEEFTVSDPNNFRISTPTYGSGILTLKR